MSGIRVEERDGVRVLHMEFGSANALGPEVVEALAEEFGDGDGPTVLTGEGRVFSAGLDLVKLDSLDHDGMADFLERFNVLMTRALTARYPLVAAVNGHAVAGGCVLAMACDERIGVDGDFKVGMNELAVGLTLPAVVVEILRGKLDHRTAHEVILRGCLYSPARARDRGLLDRLAEDSGAALDAACESARELGRAPREFAAMKGTLVAPITERLRDSRRPLDVRFLETWFTDSARQQRRRTVEKLTARRG